MLNITVCPYGHCSRSQSYSLSICAKSNHERVNKQYGCTCYKSSATFKIIKKYWVLTDSDNINARQSLVFPSIFSQTQNVECLGIATGKVYYSQIIKRYK